MSTNGGKLNFYTFRTKNENEKQKKRSWNVSSLLCYLLCFFISPSKWKMSLKNNDEKKKVKHDIISMYIISYHRKCNYSPLSSTFLHDALFINQLQHRFGRKAHKNKILSNIIINRYNVLLINCEKFIENLHTIRWSSGYIRRTTWFIVGCVGNVC